jgi:hypothetical protein
MLECWLRYMLYYSHTLCYGGLATTAMVPPVLEAMVLILDMATGIVLQLHRDLPRTEHLLGALQMPPPGAERGLQMRTAFERLAKAAVVWTRASEVLKEPLLGQGMLLRWLGGAEALPLDGASALVALTGSMLLKNMALTVDGQEARQVRRACSRVRDGCPQMSAYTQCGVWRHRLQQRRLPGCTRA